MENALKSMPSPDVSKSVEEISPNAVEQAPEDKWDEDMTWQADVAIVQYTTAMSHQAEELYKHRHEITNPTDPRMVLRDTALWTWIFIYKYAGIRPKKGDIPIAHMLAYIDFRQLYQKAKKHIPFKFPCHQRFHQTLATQRNFSHHAQIPRLQSQQRRKFGARYPSEMAELKLSPMQSRDDHILVLLSTYLSRMKR